MNNIKLIFSSVLILVFSTFLFAQENASATEIETETTSESAAENKFSQHVDFYQALFVPATVTYEMVGEQLLYTAKWNFIEGTAGLGVSNERLDLLGHVSLQPDFLRLPLGGYCFYLNLDEYLHYRYLFDVSSQFDILTGGTIGFTTETNWKVYAQCFYFLKLAGINGINKTLVDNDLAAAIHFEKTFGKNRICYGISSFDNFYYPKFFCPQFHIEYGYKFYENIITTLTVNVRYVDMFTLSSYLEEVEVKLGFGVDL